MLPINGVFWLPVWELKCGNIYLLAFSEEVVERFEIDTWVVIESLPRVEIIWKTGELINVYGENGVLEGNVGTRKTLKGFENLKICRNLKGKCIICNYWDNIEENEGLERWNIYYVQRFW